MRRNDVHAMPYWKKKVAEKLGREDERREKAEKSRPYLQACVTTITMAKKTQAGCHSLQKSSAPSFAPGLVETLYESTIPMITALFCNVVAALRVNVLDTKVQPAFVNSRYIVRQNV